MRKPPYRIAFLGPTSTWHYHEILAGLKNGCDASTQCQLVTFMGKNAFTPSVLEQVKDIDAVITCLSPDDLKSFLPHEDFPVIYCSNRERFDDVCRLVIDDQEGGRMAARHLLAQGVSSMIMALPNHFHFSKLRKTGFFEQAARVGMEPLEIDFHIEAVGDVQEYFRQAKEIEKQFIKAVKNLPSPWGIFTASDQLARQLINTLQQQNIKIPKQALIVGFDNSPETTENTPTLSSVMPDSRGMGFHSIKMIERWIETGEAPPRETLFPPLGVEERESSGGGEPEDPEVLRWTRFLKDRLTDSVTVADLVTFAGRSRRGLEIHFREVTGRSPYQFLLEERLKRARHLLRTSNDPIEKVAIQTGFGDLNTMGMAFRRHLGQSPSHFRKANR